MIAWDLPKKVRLAGVVLDKPNHMATIHLSKGAPKSTRLDAVGIRKRAATKGDAVVEVKPGEEVVSVNVAWTVDKFVSPPARVNGAKKDSGKKKEATKASANGKVKKSAAKKTAPAKEKKTAKPAKKSAPKGKKKK